MKEYLIAVDMEGVHGVMGVPYNESPIYSLPRSSEQYRNAVASATKEVNVAIAALFDSGATKVCVWDNHGGGGNLDFSLIDARAQQVTPDNNRPRMEFMGEYAFDGVVYIGYHARAGSHRGVLSHTFNGIDIQYYKLNGKQIGEFEFDSYIAASYGAPALFVASDDVCVGQVLEHSPETETVITKIAKSRRVAEYLDEEEVLAKIYEGVKRSVAKNVQPLPLSFPSAFEVRYTKVEVAEWMYESKGEKIPLTFAEDANTIRATLKNIDDLRVF